MVLCPPEVTLLGLRNLEAHSGTASASEAAPMSRDSSWGGINRRTAKFDEKAKFEENSKAFHKL